MQRLGSIGVVYRFGWYCLFNWGRLSYKTLRSSFQKLVQTCFLACFLACLLVVMFASGVSASGKNLVKPVKPVASSQFEVAWWQGQLVARFKPRQNEGYIQLVTRLTGSPKRAKLLEDFNNKRPVRLGQLVRIPLGWLPIAQQGQALRVLYPTDRITKKGWLHKVSYPHERLINLTEAYTGDRHRYLVLARYNQLANPNVLRLGQEILIPLHLIPAKMGFASLRAPLKLKETTQGLLSASYRVQPSDSLYRLLERFTDQERADEFKRMSLALAKQNGIVSPEHLSVGKELQLPLAWLSDQWLKSKTNQVLAIKVSPHKSVASKAATPKKKIVLHVLIDPGHGGKDPGAVYRHPKTKTALSEHKIVYDIALRLEKLVKASGHKAYLTMRDYRQASPTKHLQTAIRGDERVLVTPPYRMDSSEVAINMRVFLVNDLHRRLRKKGVPEKHILLISLHGDALIPTMRGAMIYYSDSQLRSSEFYPKGNIYQRRREGVPSRIRFSAENSRLIEESSRQLAISIKDSFQKNQLKISPRRPIRSFYYRKGERTLPAILRYSPIHSSILLEVANLNNPQDLLLMITPARRQNMAKAIHQALLKHRAG